MKYTNPRQLLKVNETDLYDLMLRDSRLLREVAEGGLKELAELTDLDPEAPEALAGLHRMLTYAFTCGAAFAVERQVEAAQRMIQSMRDRSKN